MEKAIYLKSILGKNHETLEIKLLKRDTRDC